MLFIIAVAFVVINFSDRPSHSEMQRWEQLSYNEGRLDSYDKAWERGRQQGYAETEAYAEYEGLINEAEAYRDGWRQGYEDGARPYREWRY